jgi:lipopolysaccharide transport system ATP-binding protein
MTVITAEHLGKKYTIGHQRQGNYVALREVLAHTARGAWQRLRHPLSPNRETTDLEEVWALKDVNFEIKQGERVGIIGRNGAGKSTLLKILSRITHPTTGRVRITGRVASLLEVGTGFHPELTGRENIYLNGAILGMTRQEIKSKFDEIVAFAEIEKFLDTPVKRYSSGMYVRLAFAVAAHLEPEILLVDEVLAVGDIRFQRKCFTKMEAVSQEGRTVVFVSHSMPTITSLCERCFLLEIGQLVRQGLTSDVVMQYYTNGETSPAAIDFTRSNKRFGDTYAMLVAGEVRDCQGQIAAEIGIDSSFSILMRFRIFQHTQITFIPNFHFYTADGICAFVSALEDGNAVPPGDYVAECDIPGTFLNEGSYFVGLALSSFEVGVTIHFYAQNCLAFNVKDPIEGTRSRKTGYSGPIPGVIRPNLTWELRKME